jgi:hypothetical protein
LKLPSPPKQYDAALEAARNQAIEKADNENLKRGRGIELSTTGAVTMASQPRCLAYVSGAMPTIPTGSGWTTLTLNAALYDVGAMHDLVTNPSRITVATAGLYMLIGKASFVANATGGRSIGISVNGSLVATSSVPAIATAGIPTHVPPAVTVLALSATDYVQIAVSQTSGGDLALTNYGTGWEYNYLCVVKVA